MYSAHHHKMKKHHKKGSSSSSSSSSSSDEEFKHLPKHERKMRKKAKKMAKKQGYGMYPGMNYPPNTGYPGYPPNAAYPPGSVQPPCSVPPGAGYPASMMQQYPQAGYPAGSYAPGQPAYGASQGYPPQQQQPGYHPQQPGYPPQQQAGYPPQQSSMYPSQQQPGYPPQQPGYPPQQPGYPPSGPSGNESSPFPAGFVMPTGGQPGYPPQPTGGQPGYPPQPTGGQPGYPPQPTGGQPGYPPQPTGGQPGYPPQPTGSQPGYPPQPTGGQPNYPSQPGYPPSQSVGGGQPSYAPQPGYPSQPSQPHYPSASPCSQINKPKALTDDMRKMAMYGGHEKFCPTVVPANPFSAEEDAKVLRKAMKGFGTDESAIIFVISKRSNSQRQQIAQMFKTMYGKDLIQDLKSELGGNFENTVLAMFKTPAYLDAWSIHEAISGIGTKESVLVEILCTRTNAEIREIQEIYKNTFRRNLEKDIISDTSGYFKRLLVSCCQANRNELTHDEMQRVATQGPNSIVNRQLAQEDARRLYEAGEKKLGTDESTMISILAIRNYYQMQATFEEYARVAGKDIMDSIRSETSGELESGLKAIVMCARDRPEYFASQLHKAISCLGTKDNALIRIVVSRSEIDLQNIKDYYQRNYGNSLYNAISSDTSGDYKKLLLSLVGQ